MRYIIQFVKTLPPIGQAFILPGLMLIILVVLIWPPAVLAIIKILEALPIFLTALSAFILAVRSKGSISRGCSRTGY